jgi:predicted RNase H-like HicB family nuclease
MNSRVLEGAQALWSSPPPSGRPCASRQFPYVLRMNIKVLVHEAEEGGFWAEVPALPGCGSQGDTMDELIANVREAIAGWLDADVATPKPGGRERILELAL